MHKDFSFFDTMKVFSYSKIDTDITPVSMETILDLYPMKPDYSTARHYKLPIERLNKEFVDLLDRAGLEPHHAEIFYRPGNGKDMDAFIHTDGHVIVPGFAKINYVVGGANNLMKWWRPLVDVTEKNIMTTPIGTKFMYFEEKECELYDQVDMQGLYVVNAAIPHSVEMSTGTVDTPRICVSVTPKIKNSQHIVAGCMDVSIRIKSALI